MNQPCNSMQSTAGEVTRRLLKASASAIPLEMYAPLSKFPSFLFLIFIWIFSGVYWIYFVYCRVKFSVVLVTRTREEVLRGLPCLHLLLRRTNLMMERSSRSTLMSPSSLSLPATLKTILCYLLVSHTLICLVSSECSRYCFSFKCNALSMNVLAFLLLVYFHTLKLVGSVLVYCYCSGVLVFCLRWAISIHHFICWEHSVLFLCYFCFSF